MPFIESPNDPFKSLAITGGHLVSKKCIVDILPAVPAGHRVGVYDPNTNHLILGRYNGTEYLYDSDSHFKWEMIWDLDDVARIISIQIGLQSVLSIILVLISRSFPLS